jgi:hypothetical protein
MNWFPMPWLAIGIFGYLIGVPFFEVIAEIGIALWLLFEALEFLGSGRGRLPGQDQRNSKQPGTHD